MSVAIYSGLVDLVEKEGMRIAEIGTHIGESLSKVLPIIEKNHGSVVAVDWFYGVEGIAENEHAWEPKSHDPRKNKFLEVTAPYSSIITLLDMRSTLAAKQFEDKSFDLVYLDGDHTYLGVLADIRSWFPKVKDGGILSGHDWQNDYNENDPNLEVYSGIVSQTGHWGVNRAVYEVFGKEKVKLFHDKEADQVPSWWITK